MHQVNKHNRLLSIGMAVFFGLLCLVGNIALAQEPVRESTVVVPNLPNDDDTIIGGTDDLRFSSRIPMAGNPTLNRVLGLQTYDDPYCKFFFEIEWLFGGESIGAGMNFAYVPKHWGGYFSLLGDDYDGWFSLGAVWRPYVKPSGFDWQLYGGAVLSWGVGYEIGTRFSANAKNNFEGAWSWMSGSLGMININGISYTTVGVSIGIISLSPFLLL